MNRFNRHKHIKRAKEEIGTMEIENYKLEIDLAGLPKSPNSLLGAHWTVRSGHAKSWKRKVMFACLGRKPKVPLKKAKLTFTRISSSKMDFDNLALSFKACADALTEAGIISDDNFEVIGQPKYEWEKGSKGHGRIKIKVEA